MASGGIENDGAHNQIFPQQFATTAWRANFTFLPSNIQLIQKKHVELLGPMDLIISS